MPYGLDKKSSQIILNYLKESTGLCGPQYGLHATQTGFENIIEPELKGTAAGSRKMPKQDPITKKSYEDDVGYDALGGESTKSQIIRGREQMPAGYDIQYQTQWSEFSDRLNSLIQAIGLSGGGVIGSVANQLFMPTIQKQFKAQLAQMYLGRGFGGGEAEKLNPHVLKYVVDAIGMGVPAAGAMSKYGADNFGVLGGIAAKQLQNIAGMGIDPLEWALNRFGAKKTAENIKELPKQRTNQALSQAGYLSRARARGIV